MPAQSPSSAAFRQLPFMGVIRVNNEAAKVGYRMGDLSWTNLGQGQPEVGDIPGAPARFSAMAIEASDHAYGPVEGLPELRERIAAHYNRLFRRGKASQYTHENVAVAAGGRAALTRIGASLSKGRLGYFTPDYTAYEDLLTTFSGIEPVWIDLPAKTGFAITPAALDDRVASDRIGALLISNPCNPTGTVVEGEDLKAWVEMARRRSCTLLMDEFYSHFHYSATGPAAGPVSAAEFIEDVDRDPVVIIDGLTKCFRYPGWRVGWVVAPKDVIKALTAAGSFLDGGPCRPIQRAAMAVLEPERADQETRAVRAEFAKKQQITISALTQMGVKFFGSPRGTFYVFGSVADLPAPLNTGVGFMREAFKHKVLTVPGEYFDVNPGRGRTGASGLESFVRFSFGPPRTNLEAGLSRLGEMVERVAGEAGK